MSNQQSRQSKPPIHWVPEPYQLVARQWQLDKAVNGLLLDPGLGKTSTTLSSIKYLKDLGVIKKVLLIAPLRVCYEVWPAEVRKWLEFNGLKIVVLHGKDKAKILEEEADIYAINNEGLPWLFGKPKKVGSKLLIDMERWKSLRFDTLVIDELTKFKHAGKSRFNLVKQVADTFERRWGLTGTPAPNGLLDLFGQCLILDGGIALGKYITQYKSKYFTQGWNKFKWSVRPGAEKEIYERIKPLMLRMRAEDYLTLPELKMNNIYVTLPPEAQKIYDELEKELIAVSPGGIITASSEAVVGTKCRQLASGAIYLDAKPGTLGLPSNDRKWQEVHNVKIEALRDLIDELQGSPLLVAYDFIHDIERIKLEFGKDVPYIGRDVTPSKVSEIVKAWNRGDLPVLFGHPKSMGHGLNLQESGHHVCWFSMNWDYELYDQFNRRVLRKGNTSKKVFVHHIIARGTIDEVVLNRLESKEVVQNDLSSALSEKNPLSRVQKFKMKVSRLRVKFYRLYI